MISATKTAGHFFVSAQYHLPPLKQHAYYPCKEGGMESERLAKFHDYTAPFPGHTLPFVQTSL